MLFSLLPREMLDHICSFLTGEEKLAFFKTTKSIPFSKFKFDDDKLITLACKNDSVSFFEWVRRILCPEVKLNIMNQCALYGSIDLMKLLQGEGCPWDEGTCSNAAASGSLKCLRYARENGCPE